MSSQAPRAPRPLTAAAVAPALRGRAAESAWKLLRSASGLAETLERAGRVAAFRLDEHAELSPQPEERPDTVLVWRPSLGWQSRLPAQDARSELLNLYLPICSATTARPMTVGHLGQSLDGFIATPSGDSQFVTGNGNIVHLHRMRALTDAVIVGARTVVADDPQLTTRLVEGLNPLRVVFDPGRRLPTTFRVFTDPTVPTLYFCARSHVAAGETHVGAATIVAVDDGEPGEDVRQMLSLLRARGCARVFVEGGGVTVSAFLEANLLDRLQIAIAPVLIGDGRPAVRLPPQGRLRDCLRPAYRVFRMGGDVLFDCDLTREADPEAPPAAPPIVNRVI